MLVTWSAGKQGPSQLCLAFLAAVLVETDDSYREKSLSGQVPYNSLAKMVSAPLHSAMDTLRPVEGSEKCPLGPRGGNRTLTRYSTSRPGLWLELYLSGQWTSK